MAARADIFLEQESWRGSLAWSTVLHVLLFGSMLLWGALSGPGETWGGTASGGGAMSATLVSTVPLPARQVPSQNVLATESPGMGITIPKPPERAPDAIPLPAPDAKKVEITKAPPPPKPAQQPQTRAAATPPPTVEPKPDVVPFGQGGPPSGSYGVFSSNTGTGGVALNGGGDFGSRYSWYVDVVRRKVSENWLKYEVDPHIADARRVYIHFDIARNGVPTNIRVAQSSGIPSLDLSAVRALQRIDTFGPLPGDYPGSRVSVEFWFDYRR